MMRRLVSTITITCLCSFGGWSCTDQTAASDEGQTAQPAAQSAELPDVVVQTPTPTDAEETLRFPGTFEPFQDVSVFARTTGYIEKLNVDIGDDVKDGDTIARLTVPALQANLREARARVSAAESDLAAANERLKAAKVSSERFSELSEENPGAVPEQKVDQTRAGKMEAQAEVESAKARIQEAKARVRELKSKRGFSVVRAPFDGVIVKRHVHEGSLVREGTSSNSQPIVDVARRDKLRYTFQIPETIAPHVSTGDTVTITPEVMPDETIKGTIARTSQYLDRETRTERAEVDLEEFPDEIEPGMIGDVTVTARRFEGALRMPSSAIRGSGEERYALVVRDGTVAKQSVTVGIETGEYTVIVDGLSKDAQVITAGSKLATPGKNVRIAEKIEGEKTGGND